jgi:hypothetical protein
MKVFGNAISQFARSGLRYADHAIGQMEVVGEMGQLRMVRGIVVAEQLAVISIEVLEAVPGPQDGLVPAIRPDKDAEPRPIGVPEKAREPAELVGSHSDKEVTDLLSTKLIAQDANQVREVCNEFTHRD